MVVVGVLKQKYILQRANQMIIQNTAVLISCRYRNLLSYRDDSSIMIWSRIPNSPIDIMNVVMRLKGSVLNSSIAEP